MENTSDTNPNQKYWLSLEQWRQDPEFVKLAENEFRSSPLQSEDGKDGWARREFLKLMGASIALSTFGCVRRPAQKIIPYAKKPEGIIHGLANHYASSYSDGAEGFGILVTTRDGRPIKIEGNPDYPLQKGGMSARAHAHILKLYDPDRSTGAKRNLLNKEKTNRETIGVKWEALDQEVSAQLAKGKSALLSGSNYSPSTKSLVSEFAEAFGTKVLFFDDLDLSYIREGQKVSYGKAVVPRYKIDKARMIVAVNNDFLGTWLTPVTFQREFMAGRQPGADMNKLVVFESLMTLTGTNADERYRIRPSQSLDVLMGLLHELIVEKKLTRYAGETSFVNTLSAFGKNKRSVGVSFSQMADELWKNRGQSLVLGGSDVESQIAANFLNYVLENEGKTVDGSSSTLLGAAGSPDSIETLIQGLNSGSIETVIIHGCNPLYSLPNQAGLREALVKAKMVIYTGDRNDETGKMADYLACDHHPLENWSDLETQEGVYSIQQPTIQPLHDTRGFQDSLIAWMKAAGKGSAKVKDSASFYEYLRGYWRDSIYAQNKGKGIAAKSFDDFWIALLQEGVFDVSSASTSDRSFNLPALTGLKSRRASESGYELSLYPTVGLGDGSLANVSWLQEFPDPVTKIVWDNYLTVSPQDAKKEGWREGQWASVQVGDVTVKAPVHIQPGQAQGVLGLAIGYGRVGAGQVADEVGVKASQLALYKKGQLQTQGLPAKVSGLKGQYALSCTQDHHSMEGRQIVVEETLAQFMKKPGGNVHRHKMMSMWSEHKYNGNKWGMVIDLNSCTGCGACVIACQSENNIPTVGKEYVARGREMHWIRIDRYYTGTPEDPGVVHQPIVCQHCDNAPCETVCPVAATVHSDEGTNDMIYNRCVGTRYCANNCPYKVRRFNWFDYTAKAEATKLVLNPEVSVRPRGVMEKCTFCIHRIRQTKSRFKLEDRQLKDGDIKTACQQSCPTHAIVFGDLNNPDSAVAKEFKAPQSYTLLEELNAAPAVRYQTRVRNVAELKADMTGFPKKHGKGGHHGEEKQHGGEKETHS